VLPFFVGAAFRIAGMPVHETGHENGRNSAHFSAQRNLFTKRDTKMVKIVFQNDKNRNIVKKGHEIDQNRVPKRERRGTRPGPREKTSRQMN